MVVCRAVDSSREPQGVDSYFTATGPGRSGFSRYELGRWTIGRPFQTHLVSRRGRGRDGISDIDTVEVGSSILPAPTKRGPPH